MNKLTNLNKIYNREHQHTLTTLSNSDLISICIKLKLKLVGVYMKDELNNNVIQVWH